MNDFDKTSVFAFYNFLKIEVNFDKENMSILDTCSFQRKMLSNLTRDLLIDFKDSGVLKIL